MMMPALKLEGNIVIGSCHHHSACLLTVSRTVPGKRRASTQICYQTLWLWAGHCPISDKAKMANIKQICHNSFPFAHVRHQQSLRMAFSWWTKTEQQQHLGQGSFSEFLHPQDDCPSVSTLPLPPTRSSCNLSKLIHVSSQDCKAKTW